MSEIIEGEEYCPGPIGAKKIHVHFRQMYYNYTFSKHEIRHAEKRNQILSRTLSNAVFTPSINKLSNDMVAHNRSQTPHEEVIIEYLFEIGILL